LTTLQLVHSFLSKSITQSIRHHGIATNRWLVAAFIVSFSLLIMGIYTPGKKKKKKGTSGVTQKHSDRHLGMVTIDICGCNFLGDGVGLLSDSSDPGGIREMVSSILSLCDLD
jgi:magnesium-transporting ATPase (P-type)